MEKDYKKLYEEAFKRAKGAYNSAKSDKENGVTDKITEYTIQLTETIFPELKESEDERIRKEIVEYIKIQQRVIKDEGHIQQANDIEKWLVWLEKQGEQKSVDSVEPKFHAGDFITDGKRIFQIEETIWERNNRNDGSTYCESLIVNLRDGNTYADNTDLKEYHLWTIQDAKDGDVLKENSCMFIIEKMKSEETAIVHCCLFDNGDFDLMGSTLSFDVDSTYPATKEQHDLLFQKMKEAGYEWDAEKKELIKIEQNSAWSEEDEKMKNLIISTLTSMGTLNLERYHHMNLDEVKKWLKSLKEK